MTTPANRTANTQECALWYWQHGAMAYALHDSEAEAAAAAAAMEEYEHGAPVGIQFPDGRLVRAAGWPAYREAQRAILAAARARHEAQPRPRPTRQVIDPFNGKPVSVDVDEPSWLGRPA